MIVTLLILVLIFQAVIIALVVAAGDMVKALIELEQYYHGSEEDLNESSD